MYMLQVTLGSGATPIIPLAPSIPSSAPFQTLVFGAAAHNYRVGDSSVSATLGALVPTGGLPLVVSTPYAPTQNLAGWYLYGTANDVVSILVLE